MRLAMFTVVAPDVVGELALPDHAGDDGPGVDTDAKLDRARRGSKFAESRDHPSAMLAARLGVVVPRLGQAAATI